MFKVLIAGPKILTWKNRYENLAKKLWQNLKSAPAKSKQSWESFS